MNNKVLNSILIINIKQICLAANGLGALVTLVALTQNVSSWIATFMVLTELIFVIGFLLLFILKVEVNKLSYAVYSIGFGLFFLLFGGLGINWLFPYFGISSPLAKIPLLIFFDGSIFTLSFLAYYFNKDYFFTINFRLPNKTNLFFGLFPLIFLFLSVLGSIILNNSGSGTLTLIMLFSIAAYVLVLMSWNKDIDEWVYVSGIYFVSLSLLLMYSLRSAHILGWDINLEYEVFQSTLQNLVWKMSSHPNLDYNACLSVTILPTIFQVLTNIGSEYIFKVIFQIIFAFTPVMLYVLAKKFLEKPFAFLASFLFLSQTWFFEQMPALIRQEIAFIFYILILLVVFDSQLSRRMRFLLFFIFNVGLVLSHYSTSYIWITLLIGGIMLSYFIKTVVPSLRNQSTIANPLILIIPLILVYIWQVSLTSTGSGLMKFITRADLSSSTSTVPYITQGENEGVITATSSVVNSDSNSDKIISNNVKNALKKVFFIDGNHNTDLEIIAASKRAINRHIEFADYKLFPDASAFGYFPKAINDKVYFSPKISNSLISFFNIIIQTSKFLFINIFPIIGIISLYFALRIRWLENEYNFIIFNIVTYGFIVVMIFTPWLQQYYNFTRLYLQMFLTLSILAMIGGVWITKYTRSYQKTILTTIVILIFLSLTSALDYITGGEVRITLNKPPAVYETFYILDSEVVSAQWLALNRGSSSRVQADIIANLRLQSFGKFSADHFGIFPQIIEQESYLYLININVNRGNAHYLYENNLLIYNYPLEFIDTHKNLIYNNGSSRIYK